MLARLLEDENGLWLLHSSGKVEAVNEGVLGNVLFLFKKINYVKNESIEHKGQPDWNKTYLDIADVPGITKAYVTENYELVIKDIEVFAPVFNSDAFILKNLITIPEYANLYNKSVEQVKVFCRTGRISGAKKIGRDWVILKNSSYPTDRRCKNNNAKMQDTKHI